MDITKKYLTTEDVGEVLSIKPATLRYWRATRKGPPYVKVGGTLIRYSAEELERWLKLQTVS